MLRDPRNLRTLRSPQTAALLNDHAKRLRAFNFSALELRWGQEVRGVRVRQLRQARHTSSKASNAHVY